MRRLVVLAAALGLIGGGVALAATSSTTRLYACVPSSGAWRAATTNVCPVGYRSVSWAVTATPTTPTTQPATTSSPTTQPATTTAPTTTVAPTTTQAPTTTTVPAGLIFDDEFSGTSLDLGKWQPNWLAGNNTDITKPVNSAEISCYDPRQVTETGGNLVLTLVHRSCTSNQGITYGWASGLVNTNAHFQFTTGTVTARVWLSGGAKVDNWPAVWNGPGSAESDIMEGLGGDACWHYHYASSQVGGCPSGTWSGWHTYGEKVTSTSITYFYDGVAVGTAANTPNAQRYLIINNGLHVQDSDHPAGVPASMLIDWIRVSQP